MQEKINLLRTHFSRFYSLFLHGDLFTLDLLLYYTVDLFPLSDYHYTVHYIYLHQNI